MKRIIYQVDAFTREVFKGNPAAVCILDRWLDATRMQQIANGDANIVAAGGQESMSQAPHVAHLRDGVKMGDMKMIDTMIKDGLWCAFNDCHMGITAENIAEKHGVSREDQDEFAASSQQKAVQAIEEDARRSAKVSR
mgnify:CR=1 FL=1